MNGRVNITDNNNIGKFLLYERPENIKSTDYKDALIGNFHVSTLSKTYFSAANITIIQNAILAGVLKKSNGRFKIGYQGEDELKIIMRAMYLQFSRNLDFNIREQITDLNKFVTDYAIPRIYNEAVGYIKYKNHVSVLAKPIDLPVSCYHSNTLEMKPFF
tara:strand:+ start:5871 stop:6350 length:480 start_codon:yes stop_codon:yes gene_type:complete